MLSTIRHDEIFNAQSNNQPITVIGAGAIGSRVFTALAELGLNNITVYDFDNVEAHNLANQIYLSYDINKPKVDGLLMWYMDKMHYSAPTHIPKTMHFINEKVIDKTPLRGTIFLLVDSMESRETIFKENIQGNTDITRVIDVRMASTHGDIFSFCPHTQGRQWLDTIFPDEQGEVSACGSSLTVGTTASILANLAVWQYMHFRTNPVAGNDKVHIYLKPLILTTGTWDK